MSLHDRIALRAYFAWLDAGWPNGQHEAHWLAAERMEWALIERAELEATERALTAKRHAAEQRAKRAAATRKANRELAAATIADGAAKPARTRRATAH